MAINNKVFEEINRKDNQTSSSLGIRRCWWSLYFQNRVHVDIDVPAKAFPIHKPEVIEPNKYANTK